MRTRVLDLDGSILGQRKLLRLYRPTVYSLKHWGPRIRLGCSPGRFARFERKLARKLGVQIDTEPHVTFVGSGDFHHVSLALLRRQAQPVNLLVIDNHPDWMRRIPFLHCGTWLHHAAQLPQVKQIFHVGGDVDFDNYFQWLAPWQAIERGKIVVLPGIRRFRGWRWAKFGNDPLLWRSNAAAPYSLPPGRLKEFLRPFRRDLASRPLYISLDKDVMAANVAPVNWDSGYLTVLQTRAILEAFLMAADGMVTGIDVVGDWSPVRLKGMFRRILHFTEHPALHVESFPATRANELVNLSLMESVDWFSQAVTDRKKEVAFAS
jgi:arginase family enzyme